LSAAVQPNDIIIPYNSGSHWVTVQIQFNDQTINVNYFDSLNNESPEINQGRDDNVVANFLRPLKEQLETKFPGRNVIYPLNVKLARIQSDNKACGVIVVENIKDLIYGNKLPTKLPLSDEIVLYLRTLQSSQLTE